jgi:hypothetical protein
MCACLCVCCVAQEQENTSQRELNQGMNSNGNENGNENGNGKKKRTASYGEKASEEAESCRKYTDIVTYLAGVSFPLTATKIIASAISERKSQLAASSDLNSSVMHSGERERSDRECCYDEVSPFYQSRVPFWVRGFIYLQLYLPLHLKAYSLLNLFLCLSSNCLRFFSVYVSLCHIFCTADSTDFDLISSPSDLNSTFHNRPTHSTCPFPTLFPQFHLLYPSPSSPDSTF